MTPLLLSPRVRYAIFSLIGGVFLFALLHGNHTRPLLALSRHLKARNSNELVIYMHIPKTGGTTLSALVSASTSNAVVKFVHWWGEPQNSEVSQLRRASTLFGHLPFGVHKLLNDSTRPFSYVVFLRHPYERVVSHFCFHLRTPGDPWFHLALKYAHNMTGWVFESEDANNLQTQFLAGVRATWNDDDPLIASAALSSPTVVNNVMQPRAINVTEEVYQRAVANFDRFVSFVGFSERFSESLAMLREWFGVNVVSRISFNVNAHVRFAELPAEVRHAIKRFNSFDMRLYQHAQRRFEEQIELFGRQRLHDATTVSIPHRSRHLV